MLAILTKRRLILGSVAGDGCRNLGNVLIHRATLEALGLPPSTSIFSVFQPISRALVRRINIHDAVIFTGCTILQSSPGHQRFFNELCSQIRVPRLCFAGAFACGERDEPPVELARWFTPPIAARDPWTSNYLSRHGVENSFVGCPTLLTGPHLPDRWSGIPSGVTLLSSTPRLANPELDAERSARLVRHEPGVAGMDVRSPHLFQGVSACLTGRLHLALPAIAKGIPVRFFGPEYWADERAAKAAGPTRFSLLRFLGLSLRGEPAAPYPQEELAFIRASFNAWRRDCDL